MAIIISKEKESELKVFGADANVTSEDAVHFGIGSVSKVLAKVGTDDGNAYFGYDKDSSTGIIVARGKVVSSRVLDVQYVAEQAKTDTLPYSAPKLKFKYVKDDKSVDYVTYDLTGEAAIGDINDVSTRVKNIEDLIGDASTGDTDDVINKVREVLDWFKNLPEDSSTAVELFKDVNDLKTKVAAATVTDTAVDGKYVSAVSQKDGKITVERADLPTLSVKEGSANYVAVDNHQVEIMTSTLGDMVGMTVKYKDADGGVVDTKDKTHTIPVYYKADGSEITPGLADAQNVATEILHDEEVIATALNDLQTQIDKMEADVKAYAVKTTVDKADSVVEIKDKDLTGAVANSSVDAGKSTYTVTVKLNDKGDAATQTIDVLNQAVVDKLVELLVAEKTRAVTKETALDTSVKDHETRLSWINLGE